MWMINVHYAFLPLNRKVSRIYPIYDMSPDKQTNNLLSRITSASLRSMIELLSSVFTLALDWSSTYCKNSSLVVLGLIRVENFDLYFLISPPLQKLAKDAAADYIWKKIFTRLSSMSPIDRC